MVSFPILPLPKPQRSSRFPVNCNRTGRKKIKLAKRGEGGASRGERGEGERALGPVVRPDVWIPPPVASCRPLGLRSSLVPRPPGSGPFRRKTGPNLTSFRGSGRFSQLSAVVRAIGRDITPGQKLSHCRRPALQPTKPPRTSRARSRRPATPPKRQNGGRERRGLARDSACVPGSPIDSLALYVLC